MKTIIWDVDDVLNNLMRAWLQDWLSRGKSIHFSYDLLTQNPPHKLLGISHQEYLTSLDDFRLSGKAANMLPSPEIMDWFCLYGDRCHNVALTATPLHAGHVSAEWVLRHFGRWVRSFNVVPSPRQRDDTGPFHKTKAGFLRWWGKADMVVDDNEENINAALSLGIRGALVPQPWNHSTLTLAQTLQTLTSVVAG